MYGDWPLFEAIIATSNADITGDPLNYVLKVTHIKWKEEQITEDASDDYLQTIQDSIKQNEKLNEELAKKLSKARKV